MSPTDEQVDQAIAAFDETWRKRPDITVKNFHEARRDSMRAALQTVIETPPEDRDMSEALAQRLRELREKATPGPWCGRLFFTLTEADSDLCDELVNNLDTIISALGQGEEMVMVPREPTEEMLREAHFEQASPQSIYANNRERAAGVWRAMIEAALSTDKEGV